MEELGEVKYKEKYKVKEGGKCDRKSRKWKKERTKRG